MPTRHVAGRLHSPIVRSLQEWADIYPGTIGVTPVFAEGNTTRNDRMPPDAAVLSLSGSRLRDVS